MDDLIKRIEAAAAPSFELDAEIAVASGQFVRERRGRDRQDWFYPVGQAWGRRNSSPYCSSHDRLPRYTASIDAALTLVPEGCEWIVEAYTSNSVKAAHVRASAWVSGAPRYFAATPALALCAAALKAHIERNEG